MLISENLYFIILFTLPAAMHVIYHAHVRKVPRIQNDKSIEIAECIVFCIAIFFINLLILKNDMKNVGHYLLLNDNQKITYQTNNPDFNYFNFIIKYFIVNTITSVCSLTFWYCIGNKLFKKAINLANKMDGSPQELIFSDVWRNLFETKKLVDVCNCCIVIEQGGNMMTAGILQTFQAPHLDDRELLLRDTEQVKEIIKNDFEKLPEEKIFYPALYEYYDGKSDLLLKFYSLDKYNGINKNNK